MRIRFVRTHRVQQGDGKGPVYNAGEVHEFAGRVAETYAEKYVRRGDAVVEENAPASVAANPAVPADGDGGSGDGGAGEAGAKPSGAADLLAALDARPPMAWLAFASAAKKLLGEDAPSTKIELIEALRVRAAQDAGDAEATA